jgi:molybdopterin adenylyltransferase
MEQTNSVLPTGKGQHLEEASKLPPIRFAIITVSDTRTPDTDINGQYLKAKIIEKGMVVAAYHIVHDEPGEIESLLGTLSRSDSQILLFNGGTGLSKRDTTYDVISRKLEKTITGFGEIFRILSYEQVGAAAMISRATAGVYSGKIVFSTPGSPAAVQLAWEKLIAPEAQHLVWEINR